MDSRDTATQRRGKQNVRFLEQLQKPHQRLLTHTISHTNLNIAVVRQYIYGQDGGIGLYCTLM